MSFDFPTLANGRYLVKQCVGFGGMAAVFKCYDTTLKVFRAVKVLRPELVARQSVRERFTTEAVAMATVNHPNIVHVYDHGLDGLTLFIVMEYLPHGSLQDHLEKNGDLSKMQAVSICLDVGRALEAAHKQDIVHRDIKPDNILLCPRGAKLTDFGIARMRMEDRRTTKTKAVMGTFPFMAPEQRLSAKKTNHQSDIYALAASLYVMLTGADPTDIFEEDEREVMLKSLDEDIRGIIDKGCRASLSERYANITEMIEDLEQVRHGADAKQSTLILEEPGEFEPGRTDFNNLIHIWSEYTGSSQDTASIVEPLQQESKGTETLIFDSDILGVEADAITQDVERADDTGQVRQVSQQETRPPVSLPEPDLAPQPLPKSDSLPVKSSDSAQSSNRMVMIVLLVIGIGVAVVAGLVSQLPTGEKAAAVENTAAPDWTYEGMYLLGSPQGQADQDRFKRARQALLNAEYGLAERLLEPLRTTYSSDPVVYNMGAVLHMLRGRAGRPTADVTAALSNSTAGQGELNAMLSLASNSWNRSNNPEELLEEWKKTRAQSDDPMVEVNYLLAVRHLKEAAFATEVRQLRKAHPDWLVLASIEILALHLSGDDAAALKATEEALLLAPDSTSLQLERIKHQIELGKLDVAEENAKQLQIRMAQKPSPSEGDSINIEDGEERDEKAMIYTLQSKINAQRGVVETTTLMMIIGDTVSSVDRMHYFQDSAQHLVQVGRFEEARKRWDVCINIEERGFFRAEDKDILTEQGRTYRALECASAQVTASLMLQSSELWTESTALLKMLMERPEIDTEVRQTYVRQLLFVQAQQSIRAGKIAEAEGLKEQLEGIPNTISLYNMDLVGQLTQDLVIAKADTEALKKTQRSLETQLLSGRESCQQALSRHRIAQKLKDSERSQRALDVIIGHSCIADPSIEGIVFGKALAERIMLGGSDEQVRKLIKAFDERWAEPDKDLRVVQEVNAVRESVRSESERMVTIVVQSVPTGASVFQGDNFIGATPFQVVLAPEQKRSVVIKSEGYEDVQMELTPLVPEVSVTLKKK